MTMNDTAKAITLFFIFFIFLLSSGNKKKCGMFLSFCCERLHAHRSFHFIAQIPFSFSTSLVIFAFLWFSSVVLVRRVSSPTCERQSNVKEKHRRRAHSFVHYWRVMPNVSKWKNEKKRQKKKIEFVFA